MEKDRTLNVALNDLIFLHKINPPTPPQAFAKQKIHLQNK